MSIQQTKRILRVAVIGLLSLQPLCAGAALAEPMPVEQAFVAKLEALDPAKPLGYLELAEELIDERDGAVSEARALARRLLVLAVALDNASGAPTQVSPSAALALASIARSDGERRWLRALANRLGDAPVDSREEATLVIPDVPPEVAFDLATALGSVRAGDGRRAARLLKRPGVEGLLASYAGLLADEAGVDPVARLRRQIEQWPQCPQCRNRRFVATPSRPGQTEAPVRLCPTCAGSPGPILPLSELIAHLRLESVLLRGGQRQWSAAVLAGEGDPLRDPEPADLPVRMGIDPQLAKFEKGEWVAPPAGVIPPASRPAVPSAPSGPAERGGPGGLGVPPAAPTKRPAAPG